MPDKKTEKRKGEHVDIVLQRKVQYGLATGLEQARFEHCPLPELDIGKIDASCTFFKKRLRLPFMVTGMTGGYRSAWEINKSLASACEEKRIVFGLGSQRAMLEDRSLEYTYMVREAASTVFLCANIGANQLAKYDKRGELGKIGAMVERTDADAVCVHLNALQESIQPEGDRDWTGVADAIGKTCEMLGVPVIAKETGAGISGTAARMLERLGVAAIDVSGAGGTSWSAVELEREKKQSDRLNEFREWGIPTAEALRQCGKAVKIPLIASGGIRSGLDVAKSIRLGATLGGAAYPFIKAHHENGRAGVLAEIGKWERSLKTAMLLTSSANLGELRKARLVG